MQNKSTFAAYKFTTYEKYSNNTVIILLLLTSSFNLHAQGRGGQGKHNMFGLKVRCIHILILKQVILLQHQVWVLLEDLATRGDFYNNMDIQFGINIANNKLEVQGTEVGTTAPVSY